MKYMDFILRDPLTADEHFSNCYQSTRFRGYFAFGFYEWLSNTTIVAQQIYLSLN